MEEYKISAKVQAHLERIKRNEIVKDYVRRMEYKSAKTKKLDIEFMNFVMGEIEKLAKALVLTNANQVMHLREVYDHMETYNQELIEFENTIVDNATKGILKRLEEARKRK